MNEAVADFASRYPFALDPFQIDALDALAAGGSVLVAAPTGSGKTIVGEFSVWMALSERGKAFYTTPLKALSNQKFGDLIALHGADKVGLLTGDNSINADAPVVVMTTEVLRNMIYERSDLLKDLRYVVLDEVHYLQDRYRGAVWEEVIIHLPLDVKIVSLSATVSNAEEFADWIQTLRGPTTAIIEEHRPVDLQQHYLIDGKLLPMFTGDPDERIPNPQVRKVEARSDRGSVRRQASHTSRGRTRRHPRRTETVELLADEGMLPAIYFIFSRKGCNIAVTQCERDGLRLTDADERTRIREYAEMRCSYLESADLGVLGYSEWLDALMSGIASHHAGLVPVFKETVEELFQAGLVKVVFATETLSLGINMPARTVVIESLSKFTGERHEILTAGEFTQLTGRAGRRGIDVVGNAVIPQQNDIPFHQIAGLASHRTYQLVSSFQPSYNMATNLVRNYSQDEAEHLLNSSFAQYRADKDVVVLERMIERNDAYIASYREKALCELGDFQGYWELRTRMQDIERRISRWESTAGRDQVRNALAMMRPGQVLLIPSGKLRGAVVVVGTDRSKRGDPRLLVVNEARRLLRIGLSDFQRPPKVIGRVPAASDGPHLKNWSAARSIDNETRKRFAHALASVPIPEDAWEPTAASQEGPHAELAEARNAVEVHPCHGCPDRDRHAQWAERGSRLHRENHGLKKRVRARTETLSRRFERVLEVLDEFGYVEDFNLSAKGHALARIYNENDLLVSETLVRGWLDDLSAPELAVIASTFVFESRGPFEISGTIPTADAKKVYGKIVRLGERMKRSEGRLGLELTRGTEAGFSEPIYGWARGMSLEEVLDDDSTPGDFIRSCKQTIDLLKQLGQVTSNDALRAKLAEATTAIDRGVVAYAGGI
ncbi:MAG: DEAD/DEAH box helicase [Actinomycetota bacterium]|nr:DEAD/DEAH box helicase [Actinomycetota bacterium]